MMANAPKVSVIVPVYNVEQYLSKCLDSIINQTLKDIEIICVNDGSTDNSQTILQEYAKKDSRIKIFDKENGGLSSARNAGLRIATGKYIGFVDSDDWIDENFYETLLNLCQQNDADIACGIAVATFDNGTIQVMDNYTDETISSPIEKIKLVTNGAVWSKLFRRELFANITFPEGLYWEDNPVLLRLLLKSNKVSYTTKVSYSYRQRENSICHDVSGYKKRLQDGITVLAEIKSIAKKQNKKLKEEIIFCFLTILLNREEYISDNKYKKSIDKLFSKKYIQNSRKTKKKSIDKLFSIKYESKNHIKRRIITIFGIKIKSKIKKINDKKILVHLHLYYHDQIDYFLDKLQNIIDCQWDLYVTIVENYDDSIKKILRFKPDAKIIMVKNKGYDVWPFVYVLNSVTLEKYDYILKIHTKGYQKVDLYNQGAGYQWRNSLVEALIGSKLQFQKCMASFEENKKIGMIGAQKCFAVCLADSIYPEETYLFDKCCEYLHIPNMRGHFIGGTIFICRSSLLKIVQQFQLQEEFFTESKCTTDKATYAHVFERLFGIFVERQGYKIYPIFPDNTCYIGAKDLDSEKVLYFKSNHASLLQNIFSIKNSSNKKHKIITIGGLKIKVQRNHLIHLFFQKKITNSGKKCIKICKIQLPQFIVRQVWK